jgi:hypothetical protein
MPPGAKQGQSANDILKNIVGELAQAATMPDADPQFFQKVIAAITQQLRQSGNPQAPGPGNGPGGPGAPPPGMPPMPPGAGAQPPPPGPPGLGGGQAGLSVTGKIGAPGNQPGPTGGAMPPTNPDELRRILGQGH